MYNYISAFCLVALLKKPFPGCFPTKVLINLASRWTCHMLIQVFEQRQVKSLILLDHISEKQTGGHHCLIHINNVNLSLFRFNSVRISWIFRFRLLLFRQTVFCSETLKKISGFMKFKEYYRILKYLHAAGINSIISLKHYYLCWSVKTTTLLHLLFLNMHLI